MKYLLVGINAKYIHSNPAIWSLRAYAYKYACAFLDSKDDIDGGNRVDIAEYTINQERKDILADIYERRPDFIGISCYIWNISMVEALVSDIRKVMPTTKIWLGGPEVSYSVNERFARMPEIDGIMIGESEGIFTELVGCYYKGQDISSVKGIAYRDGDRVVVTDSPQPLDFSTVPFPYEDINDFEHRIVYYETSRGCPFGCAYCLSSVDKKLRFRSMDQVRAELQFFLDAGIPQVKFIDRTFNCDHRRSIEIMEYIRDHDNGITNFHFEVAGDILTEDELSILESLRNGLVQLEIGVQTTNTRTLEAINRVTNLDKLKSNVARLLKNNNMHIHLDLIAGLPYEDIVSFRHSFDDVYRMGSHELQLGFLKMLSGAPINGYVESQGITYSNTPPYEVLSTAYLSYADVLELKGSEDMLEIYHNSQQFVNSEKHLTSFYESPYEMYRGLAEFYKEKAYPVMQSSRMRKYEVLLEYAATHIEDVDIELLKEYLTLDYYLRENAKSRPEFAGAVDMRATREFYDDEANIEKYLPDYKGLENKQISRMTHIEFFKHIEGGCNIVFDYKHINPVTKEAKWQVF